MKVRIVGLGVMNDDEICILSGEKATGYIDVDHEMTPCKLSLLGPGQIGTYVDVPEEYHSKLEGKIL